MLLILTFNNDIHIHKPLDKTGYSNSHQTPYIEGKVWSNYIYSITTANNSVDPQHDKGPRNDVVNWKLFEIYIHKATIYNFIWE